MVLFPAAIIKEHPEKAKFKTPCNNCGLCCRVQACEVSRNLLHSDQAPCTALEIHDGKYLCGVLLRPNFYLSHLGQGNEAEIRKSLKRILSIDDGFGCGMPDEVVLVRIEKTNAIPEDAG